MIHSMTGFGLGEAEVNGTSSTVELRSVNNRFCEVSVRLPRSLSEYESEVQARIKKNFARGRITARIQVETGKGPTRFPQDKSRRGKALHGTVERAA